MSDKANIVGRQVRAFRIQQGLTQNELVARCNVLGFDISRESLAKLETHRRQVMDKEIVLIAAALKIDKMLLFPEEQ